MKPVRVGFVGVGALVTKQHLPNCAKNPRFAVTAACDLDAPRLDHYAKRYGVPYTTQRYQELLARPDVDAVVVAVNPSQHPIIAAAAIAAGKHAYVEKPLAESLQETLKLGELARRKGVRLAVGYNRRFAPALQDCSRSSPVIPGR